MSPRKKRTKKKRTGMTEKMEMMRTKRLSDPERYRMAEVVIEHTNHRLPVIISTGSGSVYSTIEFSVAAERFGADGLMVLPPRMAPLGIKELLLFYDRVCDSVGLPIMLQDADFSG